MGRSSFNSKQNFLAASALTPKKPGRGLSFHEQILETKLRSEQAKLAALEAELPSPEALQYMRYEDMPPPSPEQEAEFDREFHALLDALFDETDDLTRLGPENGQSLQDWLIGLGHKIPDRTEWKTPLYIEKI